MKLDNFSIVIFGAAGDLTARKLMPALHELAERKKLPKEFRIIGFGRSDFDHQSFRKHFKEFKNLKDKLFFIQGSYSEKTDFDKLRDFIEKEGHEKGICANLLFYLATPPTLASDIINNLHLSGLSGKATKCQGWHKIIIEKPFGTDLKTAKKLNQILDKAFYENQIFRIDHYLAKETVQNILAFRFANGLFDRIWNKEFIDHIHINITEDFGIRHRGSYYEKAGLIRDIVQNHGLQLLALIAMENPKECLGDCVRDAKIRVFKDIKKVKADEIVIGQYQGYKKEKNVNPSSDVETFAAIKFRINNRRWKKVPFYLVAGKNLKERKTEIIIQFRPPARNLTGFDKEDLCANELIIQIQPDETIDLKFGVKKPGAKNIIEPKELKFDYKTSFRIETLTAYHQLLVDVVQGDQTRYVRKDGVEAQWKIIDSIKKIIKNRKPVVYKINSTGPKEAVELLGEEIF
ncbi:glucose-6-phosphate dehydrogenase [Candidatus Margulisiibacteriota bacterium]